MNQEINNRRLTKTQIIIMAIVIVSVLSLFRIYYKNYSKQSEIEMNKTMIQVDGENYEVHTPTNQNIDEETLKELLNDPETQEFLEVTSE